MSPQDRMNLTNENLNEAIQSTILKKHVTNVTKQPTIDINVFRY